MALFFRFGDEIDTHFVRQFVICGGTELVLKLVLLCMNEWSFAAKDTLQIFLPMIGLVEIPEGRTWLYKNVLTVSEFFNHFEKNFLNNFFGKGEYYLWCSEANYFKEINRVWVHFYNEVSRMQTEEREKHMLALLKEEESEKYKKEKRLEKIKQKKDDKTKKLESNSSSEFLKSWTETSVEDDEEIEEEEEEEEEYIVNTCRNTNALTGFTSDQSDINQGTENDAYNLDDKCKHRNESVQWATPNSERVFEKLKKVNDEDWTTVQTKKNKEKDRHIIEKPKSVKYSPSHSSKSRYSPSQKQKKRKAKTVPFNAFAKPTVASSAGPVRWADIAKGITKDTPHIEADDKRYPTPTKVFGIRETTVYVNKQQQETEFPSLNKGIKQTIRKERPNKMTFHFHSDQPVSNDIGTHFNESVDEIIDIEEAEKELQKLETCADVYDARKIETPTELSLRLSNTGECFMNDPEYTDDTKPNMFDPTNLTEEEIKTLNTRGRTQRNEIRPSVPDYYQLEMDSTNSLIDSNIDLHKEELKFEQSMGEKGKFHNIQGFDKQLVIDDSNIQGDCNGELYQNKNNILFEQTRKMIKTKSADSDIIAQNESGHNRCKSNAKKQKEKKTIAVANVSDGCITLLDHYKDPSVISPVKCRLSEAELQLLKNQINTYDTFEEQLELHESEHFMELITSVSPISEPKPNIIDDLFNTPEEIPEWLEDEEETPKEEEVWDNMTRQSKLIQASKTSESKEFAQLVPATIEIFNNSDSLHMNTVTKHKSPYDLLSSDPAIIHCIKQPSLADETSGNIADTIAKEYETDVSIFKNDIEVEPPIRGCHISSPEYIKQTQSVVEEITEVTDCMSNQIGVEKQTAVIKPLGLLPGSNPPATNCAFGQKLLENACRLEEAYDSDDSVLYPDDLDGEIFDADDEQSVKQEDGEGESFYFPSFHEETMLSAHHNKDDVSIAHHIQQLQLEQINNYYMQCKDRITDSASLDQSKFLYYAQSAGINKQKIEQYLKGAIEIEQRSAQQDRKSYPVLPQKPKQKFTKSDQNGDRVQQDSDENNQRQTYGSNIPCQSHGPPFQDVRLSPMMVQTGQHLVANPNHNAPAVVNPQQVPVMPLVPYGVLVPFSRPPMNPTTIQNIQSQQAAMSSTVRGKIQEILQSMFKSKVKSRRWKNELSRIRSLPSEKLKVIGKIMIPRDENDIICIGRH
jgi:hypothetical protein